MPRPDGKPATDLLARYSAFVAALERSQREGNFQHVEVDLPKLEAIIADIMERQYELAGLEQQAREIRERHEAPADRRPLRR